MKKPSFLQIESQWKKQGFSSIAGLDEAGRGPLAGPVVCVAVILPQGLKLAGLGDSKLVKKEEREKLYDIIMKKCDVGVGEATAELIDSLGLLKACEYGFLRALENLRGTPDLLLVDGKDHFQFPFKRESYVRGDSRIRSIAAASIVAKVHRDRLMERLHEQFPNYRFDIHKGYGTRLHRELLKKFGPSPMHRMRFRPVFEVQNVQELPLE